MVGLGQTSGASCHFNSSSIRCPLPHTRVIFWSPPQSLEICDVAPRMRYSACPHKSRCSTEFSWAGPMFWECAFLCFRNSELSRTNVIQLFETSNSNAPLHGNLQNWVIPLLLFHFSHPNPRPFPPHCILRMLDISEFVFAERGKRTNVQFRMCQCCPNPKPFFIFRLWANIENAAKNICLSFPRIAPFDMFSLLRSSTTKKVAFPLPQSFIVVAVVIRSEEH